MLHCGMVWILVKTEIRLRHSVHTYMLQDHVSQQMHTEGEGKDGKVCCQKLPR